MQTSFRPRFEALEDRCVPAVITVTKLADGVGVPGMTLREAVEKANLTPASDKIVFKTGLKGTINLDPMLGHLDISSGMRIVGPGANKLRISGQDASRIFNIDDGDAGAANVTLSKLTLTRGHAVGEAGGAIQNSENLSLKKCVLSQNTSSHGALAQVAASTLTIDNCKFLNNRSDNGGALHVSAGTWIARNSLFANNQAVHLGGAIYTSVATASIDRCVIHGNQALSGGGGGGLILFAGSLTVNRSTISGNVGRSGGGLLLLAGATIENSTISGNFAGFGTGGGIQATSSDLTLRNSTISGNTAAVNGGGMSIADGSLTIQHATIAHNLAMSGRGGGILLQDCDGVLQNTIVGRNFASIAGPDLFSVAADDEFLTGFSLIEDPSDATITPTPLQPNVIGQNPLLGPLQNNGGPTQTHALLPGSPALDAGSNPLNLPFDQRGPKFKRVKGIQADIGAFER